MSKIEVYGIGNPLIDIIINVEDQDLKELALNKGTMHLIDGGERERILSYFADKTKCYSCGGSCPNTMIALSFLGVKAALGGKIGNGEYSRIYEKQLTQNRVVSELKIAQGITGSSIILVSPDSERTMNTYLGNCQLFSPQDINPAMIEEAEYFYFTGYMWDTELQKAAILKAMEIAKQHGTKIIFDVADPFAVNRYREDFLKLIQEDVDIVFANREEAKILYHLEDPRECANKLADYCSLAVVKIGSEGSFIKRQTEELIHVPANKVSTLDTTGAGDMYAAGFIYGLTQGFSLENSGVFASFLASRIIQQQGAQFSPQKQAEIGGQIEKGAWDYRQLPS